MTTQGLLGVKLSNDRKSATCVELNSETDFATRNARFQQLVIASTGAASALPASSTQTQLSSAELLARVFEEMGKASNRKTLNKYVAYLIFDYASE